MNDQERADSQAQLERWLRWLDPKMWGCLLMIVLCIVGYIKLKLKH